MFKNANTSNVSRRHFLAVAGSVAAASSLAVGKDEKSEKPSSAPRVQVHYLITLTVDADNDEITYSAVNNNVPASPVPVAMTNKSLTVFNGDEVKWQAKGSGNKGHCARVRFTDTTPLPQKDYKWKEGEAKGDIIKTAQTPSCHYYCVAVFDKSNGEVYADDPTIIVGGKDEIEDVDKAEKELADIQKKLVFVKDVLRDAQRKLREQ